MFFRRFTLFGIIPAAFFVGSVLWIRSYPYGNEIGISFATEDFTAFSCTGSIGFTRLEILEPVTESRGKRFYCEEFDAMNIAELEPKGFVGFAVGNKINRHRSGVAISRRVAVLVPHWFVLSLLMIPFFCRWKCRFTKSRRLAQNRCVTCGFDLRASAKRCPECGSAFESLNLATCDTEVGAAPRRNL
jgi:hypothetical protein